jgi:hypothetical protein
MNDLELIDTRAVRLYERMQTAISRCYTIDDCREISRQAEAIAAYYKQIEDEDSVKKFLNVKLRAWRRIGEILHTIDNSDCETVAAHIRKIKQKLSINISDSHLRQALRIASLPIEFFDENVAEHYSIASILAAYEKLNYEIWENSPDGKAELKRRDQEQTRQQTRHTILEEDKHKRERQHEIAERDNRELQSVFDAFSDAKREVGYTMRRSDRQEMHPILLLINKPQHEILRKAAFDHHKTMQAILREGLANWLATHGYKVD